MERLIPLIALVWCGAAAEPLSAALARRSGSGSGVYAHRHARGYEPAVFVALPLHRPIPVLQLLSASAAPPSPPLPGPVRLDRAAPADYAASASHAAFARPTRPTFAEPPYRSQPQPQPPRSGTTSTWYGTERHSETSSRYWDPSASETTPARYGQRLKSRHPSAAPTRPAPQYAPDYYEPPAEEQENMPVVLYARPAEHGGYEYRRRPAKPAKKVEPVIIRIHKHRIIRDD